MHVRLINIGCGKTPTEGWINYDNSLSLRFKRLPRILLQLPLRIGVLSPAQVEYIQFLRTSSIQYADATKHIPEKKHAVDALYSSHMLEHLGTEDVQRFLVEAKRILKPSGIIRLCVPDLKNMVERYMANGNAEQFLSGTGLLRTYPKNFVQRLKAVIIGDRGHKHLYDGESLKALLTFAGFRNVEIKNAGATKIPDPGKLDLKERINDSVYVEGEN